MQAITRCKALAILALASCATASKLPEATHQNPADPMEDGPIVASDPAEALDKATISDAPTTKVISEPALPCRSLVVETDSLSGEKRTQTTRTDYAWDSNGRLVTADTTSEDTKYGTSWSKRTYRYQEDGLPLELVVWGEAKNPEGKKVAESRVTRRWTWEDGKLRELEFEHGSRASKVRAKFFLEWPNTSESIPFRGEHVDALTWLHGSRAGEDLYSLYFGGASGSPTARAKSCRQLQSAPETCEDSPLNLRFDAYGRLEEVVLADHRTTVFSGPFGLKQALKESSSGQMAEQETTTWKYNDDDLLVETHTVAASGFKDGTEEAQKHGTEFRPNSYRMNQITRDDGGRAIGYQARYGNRADNLGRAVIQHQWIYECSE